MARESKKALRDRAREIQRLLAEAYPAASCALDWRDPYELLIATILSAQTTDETVNSVTPELFAQYPGAAELAAAETEAVEKIVYRTGFFRNKTRNIIGAAQVLLSHFEGEVPRTLDELIELPGVSRKTASVVLGTAFNVAEGIVVDTHVSRLALRMGLSPVQQTKSINTDKIERDLMALLERDYWIDFGHCMVWHGRRVCQAKKPDHANCCVAHLCPQIGIIREGK